MFSLVLVILSAAHGPGSMPAPPLNQQSRSGVVLRLPSPSPLGEMGTAPDLCDFMNKNSMLAGNYACIRGDGTSISNTKFPVQAVNSPTTTTHNFCPNGSTCTGGTDSYLFTPYYQYGTTQQPLTSPVNFSMCIYATNSNIGMYITSDDSSTSRKFDMQAASGGVNVNIFSNNTTFTQIAGVGTIVKNAPHFVCFTYQFVADLTSIGNVYIDGVNVATNSTMHGPVNQSVQYPVQFGTQGSGNGGLNGQFRVGVYTETLLSPTNITAMSNFVLGSAGPAGMLDSYGNALTFTRATAATCDDGSGNITILPPGRPCIAQGGYRIRPATTNILQYYNQLGTAPWNLGATTCSAPTVTNNTADVTAPDGSSTATKVVYSACSAGGSNEDVVQTWAASATPYTGSVYARTASGTYTFNLVITSTGANGGSATCTANSTSWTRCKVPNITATAATWAFEIGFEGRGAGSTGIGAGTVYLWGAQAEAASAASDLCPTPGAASATCNAETLTTPTNSTWPTSTGCLSFDAYPTIGGASSINLSGRPFDDAAASEGMTIQPNNATSWLFRLRNAGTFTDVPITPASWTAGGLAHMWMGWDSTGLNASIRTASGTVTGSNGTITTPTGQDAAAHIGTDNSGTTAFNGVVANFVIGNTKWSCP